MNEMTFFTSLFLHDKEGIGMTPEEEELELIKNLVQAQKLNVVSSEVTEGIAFKLFGMGYNPEQVINTLKQYERDLGTRRYGDNE